MANGVRLGGQESVAQIVLEGLDVEFVAEGVARLRGDRSVVADRAPSNGVNTVATVTITADGSTTGNFTLLVGGIETDPVEPTGSGEVDLAHLLEVAGDLVGVDNVSGADLTGGVYELTFIGVLAASIVTVSVGTDTLVDGTVDLSNAEGSAADDGYPAGRRWVDLDGAVIYANFGDETGPDWRAPQSSGGILASQVVVDPEVRSQDEVQAALGELSDNLGTAETTLGALGSTVTALGGTVDALGTTVDALGTTVDGIPAWVDGRILAELTIVTEAPTSAPAAGKGPFAVNSVTRQEYYWNGSAWVALFGQFDAFLGIAGTGGQTIAEDVEAPLDWSGLITAYGANYLVGGQPTRIQVPRNGLYNILLEASIDSSAESLPFYWGVALTPQAGSTIGEVRMLGINGLSSQTIISVAWRAFLVTGNYVTILAYHHGTGGDLLWTPNSLSFRYEGAEPAA